MNSELNLLGRQKKLFTDDITRNERVITEMVRSSRFLVIGGAGTIGQSVTKEIFKRDPRVLHVIDISENNLVELVRDIRSSFGYSSGDFLTLPLDCSSPEFDAFIKHGGGYDYVLNLSALKHVRSEKDPYSLMRMVHVNILNTEKTAVQTQEMGGRKYFCVSTDKAANPVNMMGASKRIMELFLMRRSKSLPISTARFANVAFSDGSLLHGFNQRIQKRQPIAAPNDVKRYFITFQESGELCLLSTLLGENRDIFFPKLSEELNLTTFSEIAVGYLKQRGLEPMLCESEDEARAKMKEVSGASMWPCYFFESDTTGEKDFEEFFTANETLDLEKFSDVGIIKNDPIFDELTLETFLAAIKQMESSGQWTKSEMVSLFRQTLPEFEHEEKGKNLDNKM